MTFDLIIKGSTVLDAVKEEGYVADIGVSAGQIHAIGNLVKATAKETIQAGGKYTAPGFIDIQNHSDSYLTLLEIPQVPSLVTQGITTIAVGHCGASLAPLSAPEVLKSIQKWHSITGANLDWLSFAEYFKALDNYPIGVNMASLVGHSTLRRGLLGDEIRHATKEEIAIMGRVLSQSLDAGAAGLSLGLIYAHEVDASREELSGALRMVAERGKLLSVHLRSEGAHIVSALDEIVGLARESGVHVKISHFKIRGKNNWELLEEALGAIDRAYQQGLDIFFDVYPYTTSWGVLYTYLPKWAYEGGKKAILQNLKDTGTRGKIMIYLKSQYENLGDIFIASSETNPAFIGKTLSQIAKNQEISVEEAMLNVISGTNTQVVAFDHNLSPDNLKLCLKHPLSVIATDGVGYDFSYSPKEGVVHPRCFGTMPKFLSMVREDNLMSWPQAIKKITSRPAEKLGLKDRGRLATGLPADIVVFDPKEIGSRASYENPYQQAEGIEYVLVNGKVAVSKGETTQEAAGKVLRI